MNMLKNLQQQNFKEIQQRMVEIPGWEILEDANLLALKSPVQTPLNHMVWGEMTEENLSKVLRFYGKHEFFWLLSEEQVNSLPGKLRKLFVPQDDGSIFQEMVLDISEYTGYEIPRNINVLTPRSEKELQIWTSTAIESLKINEGDFKEFFYSSINVGQCIPLLVLYDDEPAGTGMVYCGSAVAGIYAMSTREKFRRRGVGRASVYSCIEIARAKSIKHAVLYASAMGAYLYTATGFKKSQVWHEFHYNGSESIPTIARKITE